MLNNAEYIRLSLENDLFWTRIMKEHAIFIESSLPAKDRQLAAQADRFKKQFERLLGGTIKLADNSVSIKSLRSEQFYTQYTEPSEQATQQFTGIDIDSNLTIMEYSIRPQTFDNADYQKAQEVSTLNRSILNQLHDFARFKSELYDDQASCRLFTFLYTSVYEHILHEAQKYMEILNRLQERDEDYNNDFESFWNHHMADHAKVMRGLFDPAETDHFNTADRFAKMFDAIVKSGKAGKTEEFEATDALSKFKAKTTQEILECKVKSIMSPLFTDHILREANYYKYLLSS